MVIVIITRDDDQTAERVVRELDARRARHARFDTAHFPRTMTLDARYSGDGAGYELRGGFGVINSDTVTSVLYRRPRPFQVDDSLPPPARAFAVAEARMGLGGALLGAEAAWVNRPTLAADAEYKPVQLTTALACGFEVPDTIITNSRAAAVEFAGAHAEVVVKTLSPPYLRRSGSVTFVPARSVPASDVAAIDLGDTAHLIQQRITKAVDVRLIAVGGAAHAAGAASDPGDQVDWRLSFAAADYRRMTVPDEVGRAVRRYLRSLGLLFGAFDFGVTDEGRWVFFECNPNGQWDWVEDRGGLAVTSSMADLLIDPHSTEPEAPW